LWFLSHANLLIADVERSSAQTPPRFYWDTADVHGAILGMSDFYAHGGSFSRDLFSNNVTLVRCLLRAGWFGPVRMLAPHKAEFATRLVHLVERPPQRLPVGGPRQFFRNALLDDPEVPLTVLANKKVGISVKVAVDLFKAVQSVGYWEDRFRDLKKRNLLDLASDEDFNYGKALNGEHFPKLRRFFNDARPSVPVNNFTDAMALCYLDHLLRIAIANGSPTPVLFVANSIMWDAVASLNDTRFLTYESTLGDPVTVLRDADYYLIRASLWLSPELETERKNPKDPLNDLKTMRAEIVSIIGNLDPESILPDKLYQISSELAQKLDQLKNLWFLDGVWVPAKAHTDLTNVVNEYLGPDAATLIKSPPSPRDIREEIARLKQQVDESVKHYSSLQRILSNIQQAVGTLASKHQLRGQPESISATKRFGLVKFSLGADVDRQIDSLFDEIFSNYDDVKTAAVNRFVERCYELLHGEPANPAETEVIVGLLWILNEDTIIDDAMRKLSRKQPTAITISLTIVQGASLLRAGHGGYRRVRSLIADLSGRLNECGSADERAAILIGMAYLNFHIWLNEREKWSRERFRERGATYGVELYRSRAFIDDAIECATDAWQASEKGTARHVYALNILVYYITEGGGKRQFDESAQAVRELMRYRADAHVWLYRFSDTLARYFYRLAKSAEDDLRPRFMNSALQFAEEAAREGVGDREVESFCAQLNLEVGGSRA
jgi:hypothetical protein